MAIAVCHGGDPIPKSPFHISVAPLLDLGKVHIQGLNSSECVSATVPSYDRRWSTNASSPSRLLKRA